MSLNKLKIVEAPETFLALADAHNALVEVLASAKGAGGVKVVVSERNIIIDGSASGLAAGYTFEEFTICDSGSPATRWWPTWTSNPEA